MKPPPPPAPEARPAAQTGAPPEAQLPAGWSVESVAANKELAEQVKQMKDPAQRAEGERLLGIVREEANASQWQAKEDERRLKKGEEVER